MEQEKRIAEQTERLKKVKSWSKRIEKLRGRKKNPMSEAKFCKKHNEHQASFNRYKNGIHFPTLEVVDRIEKALSAEGV